MKRAIRGAVNGGSPTAAIAAVCLLATPAVAQEPVSRGAAIAADASIRVYLEVPGRVSIEGWERDSIQVTGTKSAAAGPLSFGTADGAAKVGLWPEGAPDATGDLRVRVPARATVWVKVVSAGVTVHDVEGGVDVYSVSGPIRIEGSPRQVYAESMGGAVEIEVRSPSVRGRTAEGDLAFRGEAQDLSLSTVAGRIVVEGPRPESVRIESVTGDVRFAGQLAVGASLRFETHSGDVTLVLPPEPGAEITLVSVEGELESELPLEETGGRLGPRGKERQLAFGATPSAGISIYTFRGTVRLAPPGGGF